MQSGAADETQADVAVVGAGLAGLVCAQRLRQAGLRVVVLEKSRGLGGRLATRRLSGTLSGTCADHGVRYLADQGALTHLLIQTLLQQSLLQPWPTRLEVIESGEHSSPKVAYYTAQNGLTVVAKWLAAKLEIWSGQRLQRLTQTEAGWQLELEAQFDSPANSPLLARSVVMAIPAPQALALLKPLSAELPDLIPAIRSAEFDPCLTVIASYPAEPTEAILPWQAVQLIDHPELSWISLESSKGRDLQIPVLVVQSTPKFAALHLEAEDLQPVGTLLLEQAAATLAANLETALARDRSQPAALQVHRWRYGFVRQPLLERFLSACAPHPLVCSGDWCGGSQIEAALASGLAAAAQIERLLNLNSAQSLEAASPETVFSELMQQLALS
ncbi:MAG: FAD-dependent oxidoreductase [Pegethrix bostrychoides GSE-TBD4-15B]|jgi:hypothetical protein|uniref:FAD-dependent oxidoreductase n=1 Tax=Pegethrix bostrychoides GSE-TBD4-15B TaxID=2839662 RepID=A0A951PCZ8_9CYAN|nr:FAD-dependent oxidoreductase [Pegethrix bostrychoides GSE-TBD4-15B]